jgi:hypothetical protein
LTLTAEDLARVAEIAPEGAMPYSQGVVKLAPGELVGAHPHDHEGKTSYTHAFLS